MYFRLYQQRNYFIYITKPIFSCRWGATLFTFYMPLYMPVNIFLDIFRLLALTYSWLDIHILSIDTYITIDKVDVNILLNNRMSIFLVASLLYLYFYITKNFLNNKFILVLTVCITFFYYFTSCAILILKGVHFFAHPILYSSGFAPSL